MQIEFIGGARTVNDLQHLLHINGKKVLLKRWLFQGTENETFNKNKIFKYNPADILR